MKKKILLLLCLGFIPLAGIAPVKHEKEFIVIKTEPVVVFDAMLYAFEKIESNFDTKVINKLGYGGILQIGQEMIDEVNRICKKQGIKKHFRLKDRLDKALSEEMWYIVQNYHNPDYSLKRACKVWNPTASKRYYDKIREAYIKKYFEINKK